MEVKFNSDQLKYLNLNLSKKHPELSKYLESHNSEQFIFELNDEVMDDIREWSAVELIRVGFDKDYNLNKAGIILESLIDLLYT